MAGLNKSLKAGSVVFKTGDSADGMYVVRKGELVVYLQQGEKEIILAKIPEGGIVGEMALFEQMPRSASVKASIDSEITHISQDDFIKLMKQIPKWFVGLMSALSGRLRNTNDRLKKLENPDDPSHLLSPVNSSASASGSKRFGSVIRLIHILELILHRDGTKDGKEWFISRKIIEDQLIGVFGESPARVKEFLDILCAEGIFIAKMDSYRKSAFAMPNRGALAQFTQFLSMLVKHNPDISLVPEPVISMLKIINKLAAQATYDQFTVTLEELLTEAIAASLDASTWAKYIAAFNGLGEAVKSAKTSGASGLGLRVIKADLASYTKNLTLFSKIAEKGFD